MSGTMVELFQTKGSLGFGIASLDSRSPEAETLREELWELEEKSQVIQVNLGRARRSHDHRQGENHGRDSQGSAASR